MVLEKGGEGVRYVIVEYKIALCDGTQEGHGEKGTG